MNKKNSNSRKSKARNSKSNSRKSKKNSKKTYAPYFVSLDKVKFEKDAIEQHNRKNNNRIKIEMSPLSGSEPKYDPSSWDSNRIKPKHNCYSYALNHKFAKRKGKAQPGYFSGYKDVPDGQYNCDTFYKRISDDSPSLFLTTFEYKCPDGFHKGFMAVDNKSDPDYHFYRQDRNGMWSHKPGRTEVTRLDASKKEIKDPSRANRSYTYFDYKDPCFFFCVNPKLAKDHSVQVQNNSRKWFNIFN